MVVKLAFEDFLHLLLVFCSFTKAEMMMCTFHSETANFHIAFARSPGGPSRSRHGF